MIKIECPCEYSFKPTFFLQISFPDRTISLFAQKNPCPCTAFPYPASVVAVPFCGGPVFPPSLFSVSLDMVPVSASFTLFPPTGKQVGCYVSIKFRVHSAIRKVDIRPSGILLPYLTAWNTPLWVSPLFFFSPPDTSLIFQFLFFFSFFPKPLEFWFSGLYPDHFY